MWAVCYYTTRPLEQLLIGFFCWYLRRRLVMDVTSGSSLSFPPAIERGGLFTLPFMKLLLSFCLLYVDIGCRWLSDLTVKLVASLGLLFSSSSSYLKHFEISSLSYYLRLSLSVGGIEFNVSGRLCLNWPANIPSCTKAGLAVTYKVGMVGDNTCLSKFATL